ncbi:RCC1 domain-containing protein [Acidovorax sp.]|uniref:RCC1 domain-containing protein n=1 Tax=Acidovorax sp. TaxID=1872122 RepID=UPI00391F77F2
MTTAKTTTPRRSPPEQQQHQQHHRARPWHQRLPLLAPTLLLLCATTLPLLPSPTHAQTIATGARHGLALQADGSVLAWGDNRQAQLGQGRTVYAATAREVALPAKAAMVRTSRTSALVLDADGNVWSWGTNLRGELGDGTRADRATPQIIFRGASFIANGGEGAPSFVIDNNGQPWWWGPLPTGVDAPAPQRASAQVPARLARIIHSARTTVALDEQGVVWSWGEGVACGASTAYTAQPVAMRDVPPVVDISVAASAPITDRVGNVSRDLPASRITAKAADGTRWTWGTDPVYRSQTSLPPPRTTDCPPVRLAASAPSGYDPFDPYRYSMHPELVRNGVQIKTTVSGGDGYLGLTAEGDLWRWRYVNPNETPGWQVSLEKLATNVVDASGSGTQSLGLASVVMYITRDGKLYAQGSNTGGHLAVPAGGGLESSASPRRVGLPGPAASVHASGTGSHVLLQDGRIFAWGNGATPYDPSAGFVASQPLQVPTPVALPVQVKKLATALGQWLAVDADGKVWSSGGWGVYPPTHMRPVVVGESSGMPLARDVAVGGNGHGLILGVDGSVWRIGSSGGAGYLPAGTDLYTVGAWLRTPRKVLGLPATIVQVATVDDGYGASYALDAAGQVWFWGQRRNNGIAGVDGAALPVADWLVMEPMVLPLPGKAVSIHGGEFNACAVLQDGTAQCYGKLFNNHLGRRLRMHAPITAVTMGMDEDKQLTSIFAQRGGSVHLRLADGTVWALGQGRYGQLGTGAYASAAEPMPVAGLAGQGDLDLDPATPNVPTTVGTTDARQPPFRVNMELAGSPRSLAFKGEVFGSAGTPASANLYALATLGVPGPGSTWVQMDAQGHWGPLRWPVPALASNVQLTGEAQSQPLTLLPRLDGPGLEGLRLFIGYGSDVDEMLRAGRFREVLELGPDLAAPWPVY